MLTEIYKPNIELQWPPENRKSELESESAAGALKNYGAGGNGEMLPCSPRLYCVCHGTAAVQERRAKEREHIGEFY